MTRAIIIKRDGDFVIVATGAELLTSIAGQATAARDAAIAAAEAAANSAEAAENSANIAAGFLGGIMYASTSAGLAASSEGQFFTVVGDGVDTYATLYQEVSGVAVKKADLPCRGPFELLAPSGGDDEPMINAVLTAAYSAGGALVKARNGAHYLIDDTLLIGSGTTLDLSGSTIERTSAGSLRMLSNRAMLLPGTSCTIAWTAGLLATVTETAHGRSAFDYVWLRKANQAQFRGVFRIVSVTDANTYVIQLVREPTTTATGTITAVTPDVDMKVIGADFDYAWERGVSPLGTGRNTIATYFTGVANLRVEDYRCKNTEKYTLCIAAANSWSVDGIHGTNCNGDMLKIYGPNFAGNAKNIFGDTDDDFMSVHPREYDVFDSTYQVDNGDIIGVKIENINGRVRNGKLLTLYSTDTGPIIDGVEVDGVHGCVDVNSDGGVLGAQCYAEEDQGPIGSVSIRNVTASGPRIFDAVNCSIARLDLHLAGARPIDPGAPCIRVDETSDIENLVLSGRVGDGLGSSKFVDLDAGRIGHLMIDKLTYIASGGYFIIPTAPGGTIDRITIAASDVEVGGTAGGFIYLDPDYALTAPPVISLRDSEVTAYNVLRTYCPARIHVSDCTLTLANNMVKAYDNPAGPYAVRVSTRNVVKIGGNWVEGTADATIEPFSEDIEDSLLSPYIARVDGGHFLNIATGPTVGTITDPGFVDCHGTDPNSWRVRGDPVAQRY